MRMGSEAGSTGSKVPFLAHLALTGAGLVLLFAVTGGIIRLACFAFAIDEAHLSSNGQVVIALAAFGLSLIFIYVTLARRAKQRAVPEHLLTPLPDFLQPPAASRPTSELTYGFEVTLRASAFGANLDKVKGYSKLTAVYDDLRDAQFREADASAPSAAETAQ